MIEKIIEFAKSLLGKPYVWGGESDAEGGYDCSGYVYTVLKNAGLKVSRLTAQGFYNLFKGNKCDKATKGALLFFGSSTSKITHVAISAGDGVHMYESIGTSKNTKTNKGKGVTYSLITRRKDLVAACLPYVETSTVTYYPKYTGAGTSIVGALTSVGEKDTTYAHRKKIAVANGISNYSGTAAQNIKMVNLLKAGKLIKA